VGQFEVRAIEVAENAVFREVPMPLVFRTLFDVIDAEALRIDE